MVGTIPISMPRIKSAPSTAMTVVMLLFRKRWMKREAGRQTTRKEATPCSPLQRDKSPMEAKIARANRSGYWRPGRGEIDRPAALPGKDPWAMMGVWKWRDLRDRRLDPSTEDDSPSPLPSINQTGLP